MKKRKNSEEFSDIKYTEQSLQIPREGDQVDTATSKGAISRDKANQDSSEGLKGRQGSTQLEKS